MFQDKQSGVVPECSRSFRKVIKASVSVEKWFGDTIDQ